MKEMKKKIFKVISLILILILFLSVSYNNVFASDAGTIIDPNDYEPDSMASAENADNILTIGNDIIGFLQIAGSILSVIVLVVVGIKYMIASAEERAEYKKTLMPYVIGAIMVFGITNILAIVVNVSGKLFL